jgi:hypothetical protein
MKKVIWIIVVLAIAGYFVNSYLQKRAKREAERAEAERIEQNIKSSVAEMVSRTNAVDGWDRQLSKGERFRFDPILTIELEKLWLVNRPILFIGAIKDIATHNEVHYIVSVEKSLFGSFDYMFDTELQLSLISPKQRIDSFLNQHPNLFKKYGFNNGVAVIAKVNAIRTIYIPGEEGERDEVRIGDGELVDIVYTGRVRF